MADSKPKEKLKKGHTQKRYPIEYKMEALKLLEMNDMIYRRTARKLGISDQTLKRWHMNYGGELEKAEKMRQVAAVVVEDVANRNAGILDEIYTAKMSILTRINEIAPYSMNLDNLQKALKTLCEIDGTSKSLEVNTPNQSMTLIESLTQNFNNYESKTPLKPIGNTKE